MNAVSITFDEGGLNETVISRELERQIQEVIDKSSPENKHSDIENLLTNFVNDNVEELTQRELSVYIPPFLRIVSNIAETFGVRNLNIPVDIISFMTSSIEKETKTKRDVHKQNKRKAILDAAMNVFSRDGFHEAHVDDIADCADVSKGTVYRYFSSKEEILKELIVESNNRLVDGLSAIFNKDTHILELIKEAIAYYIDFFESNDKLYKILIHAPWISKNISEHFYRTIISHLPMLRRRILVLNKEGVLKTTDFYTVFYGIFGFIDGVIQKWIMRKCEYPLKNELPVIIEVLFYGFVGDKSRKKIFSLESGELVEAEDSAQTV